MERKKKRKEKEDAARKRQQSKLAKAKAKSLKVKVKQNKKLELDDDSDDSEEINRQICYTCETAFQMDASDWISVRNAIRNFTSSVFHSMKLISWITFLNVNIAELYMLGSDTVLFCFW